MKRIQIHELGNLKKDDQFELATSITTRSIPKDKVGRSNGLDQNELLRTTCRGKYKYIRKTPEGEHVIEGRKQGNGRHLYHFFVKIPPAN